VDGNIRDPGAFVPIEELQFPSGIDLLRAWQSGDEIASERLRTILGQTIAGNHDEIFRKPAPIDQVHVCGPVDLLTLTIMFRLYGITTERFYKDDPARFIRCSLMVQRLMGMQKQYISWPVYGFTAEALGQSIIYSDQYSPGSDPDDLRFDRDNWQSVETPDLDNGIPKLLEHYADWFHRLTGQQPVLHLTAPYSIAADTFGQETIINALTNEPEFVNQFLDLLADRVLEPWIERFFQRYPEGWVELSDASGSPFFIGPQNCRDMAIRSSQRLKSNNHWGTRVYDANYRGDYVTCAEKTTKKPSRRRAKSGATVVKISLEDLFEIKNSVCPDYVIRLAEDRIPTAFYETQAIENTKPLFLGIGATQIDRNSIADLPTHKILTQSMSIAYVETIKRVALSIATNGYKNRQPPWPGNIYFEDISAESSFDLIEIIIRTVLEEGNFSLKPV
jgi:hypothetical protein